MSETVKAPDCMNCKHLHEKDMSKNECDAFPGGIPEEILMGEREHKKPYPGDNGIRFEPKNDLTTKQA